MMTDQTKPPVKDNTSIKDSEFIVFYQEYLPRIYNFFRYRFGDDALAEDLTSTTFEKAWKKRDHYRRDLAAFSTWLFSIARRIAIDNYRKRQGDYPLEMLIRQAGRDELYETIQHQDDISRLTDLLQKLDGNDRELIALKYGAAITNRAIAHLTGISEANVGVRLFRIIAGLKAEWDK